MLGLGIRRRWVWWVGAAVCLWVAGDGLLPAAGEGLAGEASGKGAGHGVGRKGAVVLTPWERAERGRQALEAAPAGVRTAGQYGQVMDGYRAIYHDAPGDMHAAAAVNAVAELLVEEGRGGTEGSGAGGSGGTRTGAGRARSPQALKSLRAAVGQYEFLRKEYPGSSLRVGALLAEAQIEENDLGDRAGARFLYQELLDRYPGSSMVEEARAGLASLDGDGAKGSSGGRRGGLPTHRDEVAVNGLAGGVGAGTVGSPRGGSGGGLPLHRGGAVINGVDGRGAGAGGGSGDRASGLSPHHGEAAMNGAPGVVPGQAEVGMGQGAKAAGVGESRPPTYRGEAAMNGAPGVKDNVAGQGSATERQEVRTGPLAMVKGIRHWSTPNYTRVAIDLGDAVTYEAARVPHPDRIYFDLHGTRLAQDLVGKSFGVTDDGYLKKIRAAQFSDNMTRVVLDVNDVTEYTAFLLPNPYRLIIDIHGGSKAEQTPVTMGAIPTPAKAVPTVPNTTAVRSTGTGEVARLSEQPGRVEATTAPTSRPIAAVVQGRRGEEASAGSGAGGKAFAVAGPGSGSGPGTGSGAVAGSGSGATGGALGSFGVGGTGGDRGGPGLAQEAHEGGATGVLVGSGSAGFGSGGAGLRRGRKGKVTAANDARVVGDPGVPARVAVPTADGQTSLVRALGLKIGRIVIDAGHGGHDSGTLGVDGLEEKDVVLDVALRLGALLKQRLGADVIYTRSDDTFVPLETRTAIANKAQADLFLSIHANSSEDATARGVETYYLDFTSKIASLQVAARENAVSDQSIYQLSDLVKKIAMKDKIAESREFASDVEAGLVGGLAAGNAGLRDRGVKKAPFVVLIGANMPSVLAEISFVTNPRDARQLRQPEYRERVAESLYKGVAKYAAGLSGAAGRMATERAGGN